MWPEILFLPKIIIALFTRHITNHFRVGIQRYFSPCSQHTSIMLSSDPTPHLTLCRQLARAQQLERDLAAAQEQILQSQQVWVDGWRDHVWILCAQYHTNPSRSYLYLSFHPSPRHFPPRFPLPLSLPSLLTLPFPFLSPLPLTLPSPLTLFLSSPTPPAHTHRPARCPSNTPPISSGSHTTRSAR